MQPFRVPAVTVGTQTSMLKVKVECAPDHFEIHLQHAEAGILSPNKLIK